MSTQVVVLLPGIMGSVLQLNGAQVWPGSTLDLVFNQPYPNLANLLDPAAVATDVIRSVCAQDIYITLIDALEAMGYPESPAGGTGPRLVICPYDWRKGNADSASVLDKVITAIAAATPDAQITLLAHSMGGLVARYYLETRDFCGHPGFNQVTALLMLATPNRGAISALETILGLRDTPFLARNQAVTLCSDPRYPSAYELLPPPGSPFLWDAGSGNGLKPYNLYVSSTAAALGLDPTNLAAAAHFQGALLGGTRPSSVRYFTFVGTQFPTSSASLLSGSTITSIQPDDSGDGTVPAWSAQLPGIQQLSIGGGHMTIFQDAALLQYVSQLLPPSGPAPASAKPASRRSPTLTAQLHVRNHILSRGDPLHVALSVPAFASLPPTAKNALLSSSKTATQTGSIRVQPIMVDAKGAAESLGLPVIHQDTPAPGPSFPRINILLPTSIPPGPYRVGYFPPRSRSGKPASYAIVMVK